MKIEELHEILKKKHKKYVSDIVTVDSFDPSLGPDYKSIYITKKRPPLTIIISQIDGKEDILKFDYEKVANGWKVDLFYCED